MTDTTKVEGYLIEGACYCAAHAAPVTQEETDTGHAYPLFFGDDTIWSCTTCIAERAPKYLEESRVTGKRETTPPLNRSRTGYGAKLPSAFMLQLDGKRWHRVYTMCWSNMGTNYVIVGGANLLLDFDPR